MTLAMIMELSSANQGTLHVDVLVQKIYKIVVIDAILIHVQKGRSQLVR